MRYKPDVHFLQLMGCEPVLNEITFRIKMVILAGISIFPGFVQRKYISVQNLSPCIRFVALWNIQIL